MIDSFSTKEFLIFFMTFNYFSGFLEFFHESLSFWYFCKEKLSCNIDLKKNTVGNLLFWEYQQIVVIFLLLLNKAKLFFHKPWNIILPWAGQIFNVFNRDPPNTLQLCLAKKKFFKLSWKMYVVSFQDLKMYAHTAGIYKLASAKSFYW